MQFLPVLSISTRPHLTRFNADITPHVIVRQSVPFPATSSYSKTTAPSIHLPVQWRHKLPDLSASPISYSL